MVNSFQTKILMVNWVRDLGLGVYIVLYSYLCDAQVSFFFSFPLRPFVPMLMDYTYPKLPLLRAISLSYCLIVLQKKFSQIP
jgi:hypothetical protein